MFIFKITASESVVDIPEYEQILNKINKNEDIPNDLWDSWIKTGSREAFNIVYNLFKTGQDNKISENILKYLIDKYEDMFVELIYQLTLDNIDVSKLKDLLKLQRLKENESNNELEEQLERIKYEKSKNNKGEKLSPLDELPKPDIYDVQVNNIIENKINEISLRDANNRMQSHNKSVNTIEKLNDSINIKDKHLYKQKSEMSNINSRIIDRLKREYYGISAIKSIEDYYKDEIDILRESIDEKNIDANLIDEGADLNDKSYDDEVNTEIKRYEDILNNLNDIENLSPSEATDKLYNKFLLIPNDTEIPYLSGLKKEFKEMRDYFNTCNSLEKEINNLKTELNNRIQENSSRNKLLTQQDIEKQVYEYRKSIENKYKDFSEEKINELENDYRNILKNENKKILKSMNVEISGKDLEDLLESIFKVKHKNLTLEQLESIYNELKSYDINIDFNDLLKYIDNRHVFEVPILK